jgi:hypothetical protein
MDVRVNLRTRTSAHLRVVESKIYQIPWRWWANVAAQVGCKHRAIAARKINCIFYLKTQVPRLKSYYYYYDESEFWYFPSSFGWIIIHNIYLIPTITIMTSTISRLVQFLNGFGLDF